MAKTASMAKASRVRASVVALMVGFSVMSYFDRTIMSIAGPGIIKEFVLSETEMGWVYSGFLVSYTVLMIPGGYWADRFGPRLVLTMMGLGAALFTGLTALGGRPGLGIFLGIVPSFILIRLAFGVCTAPLYPSCARMSANWVPVRHRARVWGFVSAGAGLGAATSPLLFTWSIARYGWRLSFWQAAAATAALALIWSWYVRDHPAEHPSVGGEGSRFLLGEFEDVPGSRAGPTPWRRLLTDKNLMLLTAGYFTVNYFEYIFFYWIYYYFGQILRMSPSQSAIYTTAIFLTWMVMTPLGGWIADRLSDRYGRKAGRRCVSIIGLTFGAFFLYCGINLTSPLATATVLSLAVGFGGASDGPYWASAIDVGNRQVGAACGILNAGGNLGGSFAPVVTPFIASYLGWSWGLYIACLVLMLGALSWFFIDPTRAITETGPVSARLQSEPV